MLRDTRLIQSDENEIILLLKNPDVHDQITHLFVEVDDLAVTAWYLDPVLHHLCPNSIFYYYNLFNYH